MIIGSPLLSKSFSAENIELLELATSWGDIEIIGGDYKDVRIEVYPYRRGFLNFFMKEPMGKSSFDELAYRINKTDNALIVKSPNISTTWFDSLFSGSQVCFRVFVPKHISVNLKSVIGNLNLTNIEGNHVLNSSIGKTMLNGVNGSVKNLRKNFGGGLRIENCKGNFELNTTGGNVVVLNSEGEHNYSTDGGNVSVSDFNGKINCKTKGGNVVVNRLNGDVRAMSWGGNVKLFGIRGNVAATTRGGNVKADMDELREYLYLETSGGNVRATIPENSQISLQTRGAQVKEYGNFNYFKNVGDVPYQKEGVCEVNLKTIGGNVRIYGKKQNDYIPASKPNPMGNFQFAKPKKQEDSVKKPKVERVPKVKAIDKNWSFSPFIPSVTQLVSAFAFTILFVYGLNSITYFTSELFNPTSLEAEQNKAVALLNLTTGLSSFFGVIIFISFFEKFIPKTWAKYFALIGVTSVAFFLIHMIVNSAFPVDENVNDFRHYFSQITRPKEFFITDSLSVFFYGIIPSFVACAYFTYWRRSISLNRKITEQEYQLLNLDKLKTKAQLTALEARINPHFLYNSLNSIAGLIHEDQDKAEDMTVELSKLFRATTGRNNESNHSIEEEISLVKSYLAIEQMRFGERLTYEINVEEKLNQVKIPRFLLQPLVENAIKHGISKIASDGIIKVDIKEVEGFIVIDIHDNGPNFGEAVSGGYGLKSVRQKLRLIYGNKASLEITNEPSKNIQIKIDQDHEI
jgi:two-component system, LytTR family, sensor kinase